MWPVHLEIIPCGGSLETSLLEMLLIGSPLGSILIFLRYLLHLKIYSYSYKQKDINPDSYNSIPRGFQAQASISVFAPLDGQPPEAKYCKIGSTTLPIGTAHRSYLFFSIADKFVFASTAMSSDSKKTWHDGSMLKTTLLKTAQSSSYQPLNPRVANQSTESRRSYILKLILFCIYHFYVL